ncbi:MAG: alpha/beta hydrolase family protein [Planctomycetes bacterium]|nr:alpha/beta hydrolase family protein [Planctomycetota bacterium]
MSKWSHRWHSPSLGREITLTRWGELGRPVLVFPTAGADAEEIERFHLIDAVAPFLADGRVKIYSIDNVASRAWLAEDRSVGFAGFIHQRLDEALMREVLPAIRWDCRAGEDLELITAGASLGAFMAASTICRHPEVFAKAICMSGSYELTRFLHGPLNEDLAWVSPLHFVRRLPDGSDWLRRLRERFVLIAYGGGRWENPDQNWALADALGARGIPNRVDRWGPEWDHDWVTWRRMLPTYLGELL